MTTKSNRPHKYDIPEELRKAHNEHCRLRKAGKPVPADVRKGACEFTKRWNRELDPMIGKRHQYKYDIPEELHEASREYRRLLNANKPIPEDVRKRYNKYSGMVAKAHGPMTATRKHDIPDHLLKACLLYQQLRKMGKPIPDDVREGMNEYHRLYRRINDPKVGTRRLVKQASRKAKPKN